IRQSLAAFPAWTSDARLKVAASGYNCGMARAIAAAKDGDSDLRTTGHDYGKDVIARMAIFAALMAAQAPAPAPVQAPAATTQASSPAPVPAQDPAAAQ
ncbi:MAG TPA: hypothetical protein VK753_11430, partial [Xanthomonadaceae bacterium]|nr:hypothetical protein [Xanthomonadaceae bacterium]